MTNKQILLIDDDQRLAQMLETFLSQSGYSVAHALTATQGLSMLDKTCSLVVLDLMLPDLDGLEVCRRIRALPYAHRNIPILMLTAKGDAMDRIIGLEMGADDYLPKPFEPRELLARIRAILRGRADHSSALPTATQLMEQGVLRFGTLEINPNNRQASVQGNLCDLTSYQFDLLLALAEGAGRVLSREQILEAARGRELDPLDRSIDVHIGRIRSAIETDPKDPKRLLTVRGEGYVFAKQQN